MELTFIQYRNLIKKAIDGCTSNLKTFVINLNKTKDLTEDEKKEIEDIITQGMQWESKKRMLSLVELRNQSGADLFEIFVPKKEELYFDAKVSEQISDLIFILQNGEKLRKYNQTDNIVGLFSGKSGDTIKNEINKLIINNIKNNKEIICGNLFKVKNE